MVVPGVIAVRRWRSSSRPGVISEDLVWPARVFVSGVIARGMGEWRWGDCYPVQPATPPTETPTTSPSQLPAQVVSPLLRSPAPGVRTERLADPQVRDAEGVDRAAPCPYAAAA
jgi:hypothetical protein